VFILFAFVQPDSSFLAVGTVDGFLHLRERSTEPDEEKDGWERRAYTNHKREMAARWAAKKKKKDVRFKGHPVVDKKDDTRGQLSAGDLIIAKLGGGGPGKGMIEPDKSMKQFKFGIAFFEALCKYVLKSVTFLDWN
jgi:hypothetical protein